MNIKIPKADHKAICEDYMSGTRPIWKIAKEKNVSKACIEKILKTHGVSKGHRTHSMDESYFEKVDTANKAYFLGLIFADGCNKIQSVFLGLAEGDQYLVEALRKDVNYGGKIYIMKRKKPHHKIRYCLELCSLKMTEDISNLGCPPNKSLILKFPTSVPDNLMCHFLRGYFDGDGSVFSPTYKGSVSLNASITSSPDFCAGLIKYLSDRLGIIANQGRYKHSLAQDVKMTTRASLVFLDHIYRDAPIKMERKFNRFLSFLNDHSPNGTRGSTIPDSRIWEIKEFWSKDSRNVKTQADSV